MKRKYRIVVEVEGGMTLFDSTNSTKQVEEWIDAATKGGKAKSIKIYTLNNTIGAYGLDRCIEKAEEPVERVIGFGRW